MTKLYPEFIALPWTVHLEPVCGCNLKCDWCPVCLDKKLQSANNWKFMSTELLFKFCSQFLAMRENYAPHADFGWPRVEIAMRGEPLLHPKILDWLQVLRDGLPRCQVTMFSNGIALLKNPSLLNQLYGAGLNILQVDCYNRSIGKFRKQLYKAADSSVEKVDPANFSPYRKHPGGHKRKILSLLVGIEDQEKSINVRLLDNMGGWSSPENLKKYGWKLRGELPLAGKRCVRPFREFVLWYDGLVDVCCVDWYPSKAMTLGSLQEKTVEEVWYGARHLNVLRGLYRGRRGWGLCETCDYFGGYRPGFLKNPFTGDDPLRRD